MKRNMLTKFLGSFFKQFSTSRPPIRRIKLSVDSLESRDVMTASITPGWLAAPSASDLFNASNASIVSGSSAYSNDYNLNHLIDGNPSNAEPNNTIFADGQSPGFTDYAVIRTNAPVNLSDYRILLGQDGTGSANRSADAVRLYASADGVSYQLISQASGLSTNDVDPNDGNTGYAFAGNDAWLTVSETFNSAVSAQFFRIEVDRHGSMGLRVFEIDGFGTIDTSTPPSGTATVTPGIVGAAANDLFDPSQGSAIVGSATYNSDFGIKKMTDGAAGASESNHTIFADGQPAGSTDYAVVRTAAPAQLTGYRLTLGQDSLTDSNRSADAIRVYASMDGITYTLISSATNLTAGKSSGYAYRFGDNTITISETFAAPISGQFFKLEIDRHGTTGVRVMEFDGFGTQGVGVNRLKENVFNSDTNVLANGDDAPGLVNGVSSSSAYPGFNPADAFGHVSSQYEPGHFIFADGTSGDSLSWTTKQAITLTGYRIGLDGDGDTSFRGSGRVRLYAGMGSATTLIDEFENGAMSGVVSRLLASEFTADHYRLEIVRSGAGGPRVTEIDAIVGQHAPTSAPAQISREVAHGNDFTIDPSGYLNDADGDTLTISVSAAPTHGTITAFGDGTLHYTPGGGYTGPDTFTISASDGALSASLTVTIEITNNAPTINYVPSYRVAKGGSVEIADLSQGGSDQDFDFLTPVVTRLPSHGTLSSNGDGTFSYSPNGNYVGTDTFDFRLSDGTSATEERTSAIYVVDAAMVASDLTVVASIDGSRPFSDSELKARVSGGFDPNLLVVSSVVDNQDGTYTYTVADGVSTASATVFVMQAQDLNWQAVSFRTYALQVINDLNNGNPLTRTRVNELLERQNLTAPQQAVLYVLRSYAFNSGENRAVLGPFAPSFGLAAQEGEISVAAINALHNRYQANPDEGGILAQEKALRLQSREVYGAFENFRGTFQIASRNQRLFPVTSEEYRQMNAADRVALAQRLADSISQSQLYGDCSFLSTLSSTLRNQGFNWLRSNIREVRNNDGSVTAFEVRLYNKNQPVNGAPSEVWRRVELPNAALRMQHSYTRDGSLWLVVYERAYLQFRQSQFVQANPGRFVRIEGGFFLQEAATGETLTDASVRLLGTTQATYWDLATQLQNGNDLWNALNRSSYQSMTAASFGTFTPQQTALMANLGVRIVSTHAYSIVGTQTENGVQYVRLRNPHNTSYANNIAGGGVFRLTIADFKALFVELATNDPTLIAVANP